MKALIPCRLITLAACLALALVVIPAESAVITGHGGDTFALTPSPVPGTFIDTVDGAAQVSLLGNCSFHAEQAITFPASPGQPLIIKGVWRFTSADGTTTLDAETNGTGTPDSTNPSFVNIQFEVKFTGGTGRMANARGKGRIEGVGMLTSPAGGIATWLLKGLVFARGQEDHEEKILKGDGN